MSKFGKRFVSCLLAVMMIVSLFPLSAFASNDGNGASDDTNGTVSSEQSTTAVAKIGDKEYGTLQEAVNDAPADGTETTIELLSDILDLTTDQIVTIPDSKNIILDMNSHQITVTTDFEGRPLKNYGVLTVKGNGTIDSSASDTGGYGAIDNYGTLTIENGTYTGSVNGSGASIKNRPNCILTINDGTFNGAPTAVYNEGITKIYNGLFDCHSCSSCNNNSWGYTIQSHKNSSGNSPELYFYNGTVIGVQGAFSSSAGYTEIHDGSFETVSCDNHKDGSSSYYPLYIAGEDEDVKCVVYGGTFKSVSKTAALIGNDNTNGDGGINANATSEIFGGTFIAPNTQKAITGATNTGNPIIFGGTFSSDPTAYVKNGYKAENSNGTWTVGAEAPVAQISDKQYASLEDAVTAASSGDTITMLQNAETTDVSISGKSNLTIDGNGYSLHSVNFGGNNSGITLQNVTFTQTTQTNLIGINGQDNNNITISKCTFTVDESAKIEGNGPWCGIYVQKTSDGLSIKDNTFTLNPENANNYQCIGFAYAPDARATNATITGNTVVSNSTSGDAYLVIGGSNASNMEYGITNLTVSNNTLTEMSTGSLFGTWLANTNGLTVSDNTFNCPNGAGVCLNTSAAGCAANKNISINNNKGNPPHFIELYYSQPIANGFTTDVPADKILIYNGNDALPLIKVAFNANSGSCDVATSVLPLSDGAASMDALPTPTRSGYTFDGWFTAADGGEQVKEDHVFSADTTLYAHWTKISSGGGSTVTPAPTPEPEEPSDSEETVTNPDGSTTTTITKEDGSSSTTTVGTDGKVESEVTVSKDAVDNANGSAVTLPIPEVPVTTDKTTAPTVTVNLPSKDATKVEVPVKDVTAGTVAVLVDADGNETVIKDTVQSDNGITFEVTDGATIKVVDNSKSFNDVADNYWGADAIDFATSRELFAGTAENTFSPEGDMTRAMIWSVLARYEGADIPGGTGDTWYAGPQEWAMENGISDGTMPNSSMTREQFAAMLYRYVGSPAVSGTVGNYSDADSISSWAQDAMVWAVQQGLITGMGDGTLNPQGTATRTQVAAIFQRFIENQMA